MMWQVDAQTGAHRPYATGLRNPTALAVQPGTGQLWAVVNERDELGPNLVPDYLTAVREGAFYGWPYSYWGQNVDSRVRPHDPQKVAATARPITASDRITRRWGSLSPYPGWARASPKASSSASMAAGTDMNRSVIGWCSCRSDVAGQRERRSNLRPASSAEAERRAGVR